MGPFFKSRDAWSLLFIKFRSLWTMWLWHWAQDAQLLVQNLSILARKKLQKRKQDFSSQIQIGWALFFIVRDMCLANSTLCSHMAFLVSQVDKLNDADFLPSSYFAKMHFGLNSASDGPFLNFFQSGWRQN